MSSARALPGLIVAGAPTARAPARHFRVVEHDGVGGNDGTGAHDHTMQHDGAVADEGTVLDRAAFEMDDVADHAVVADCGRMHQRRVQDAAILHARPRPDADLAVVATEHRVGPDRRARPDRH